MLDLLRDVFPRFVTRTQACPDAHPKHWRAALAEPALTELERRLQVPLPCSYRSFLTRTGGFVLFGGSVQFGASHPFVHEFPALELLSREQRQVVQARGGAWPPPSQGMLCFAEYFLEADGDQVLFDVRGGLVDGEYPVVYYSHEAPAAIRRVAGSFAEWLEHHCVDDLTG